jgi:hypothetical protein
MSVRGRISHCETPARAAHRNETRGNAGDCFPSPTSTIRLLFEPGAVGFFLFLRGRCEEGVGGAITIVARWLQHGPLTSRVERMEARGTEEVRRREKLGFNRRSKYRDARDQSTQEDQYGGPEVLLGDMSSAAHRATREWQRSCPEVPAKSPLRVHRICWAVPDSNLFGQAESLSASL